MTHIAIALLFLVQAAQAAPPELTGHWEQMCLRTPIKTGTCSWFLFHQVGAAVSVHEVTQSRVKEVVRDGKHVFREVTTKVGPLSVAVSPTHLSWTNTDGTEVTIRVEHTTGTLGLWHGEAQLFRMNR